MTTTKKDLFSTALEAKDYRSFIRLVMERRYAHRSMTLNELATKAGFASKGFMSDLLAGRKRLTAKTLPGIIAGLSLPKRLASYFEMMVFLEERDLRPKDFDEKEIQLRLTRLRRVFKDRSQTNPGEKAKSAIYSHNVYKTYAAMGSAENGASLAQILQRSHLSEKTVRSALQLLQSLELVTETKGRYYAEMGNIEAFGLNESSGLQDVMSSALTAFSQKIEKIHRHPQDFYFYASFALEPEKELLLKQKLQEVISSFVDENQSEDANLVKTLVIGLF